MVTYKTLTDVQIDAVYLSALGPGSLHLVAADLMHACTVARNTHGDFAEAEQTAARKTVAAAYNARIDSKAGDAMVHCDVGGHMYRDTKPRHT